VFGLGGGGWEGEERSVRSYGREKEETIGRPRLGWKDDIRIDLKVLELEGVDCIDLAQNRGKWWAVVKLVMTLRVPQNGTNFLTTFICVYFVFVYLFVFVVFVLV
jgi:hypothetical protein